MAESFDTVKIESKQGRLIVFSNYQLVHRVLRMINNTNNVSKRDFIALFVVDQRYPLTTTSEIFINNKYSDKYLELDSNEIISKRNKLFMDQLKPKG